MDAESDLPGSSKRPPKGNQRAPLAPKAPTPEPAPEVVPPRRRESAVPSVARRPKRCRYSVSSSKPDQATDTINRVPVKRKPLKMSAPSAARVSTPKAKESGVRLELCCLCDKTETDQMFKFIPYHYKLIIIIFKLKSFRRRTTIELANDKRKLKFNKWCCGMPPIFKWPAARIGPARADPGGVVRINISERKNTDAYKKMLKLTFAVIKVIQSEHILFKHNIIFVFY